MHVSIDSTPPGILREYYILTVAMCSQRACAYSGHVTKILHIISLSKLGHTYMMLFPLYKPLYYLFILYGDSLVRPTSMESIKISKYHNRY